MNTDKKIRLTMSKVENPSDHGRSSALPDVAETFLLETGPALSPIRSGDAKPNEAFGRLMRELPHRRRMIKTARGVIGQNSAAQGAL